MSEPKDRKLVSRREIAGMLGAAFGAAALSGCAAGASPGRVTQALSSASSTEWCDTITDLKALVGSSYEVVLVAGYWAPGDGGGGFFRWDPGATAADDGGTVIQPSGVGGAGRWRRLFDGAFNVKWFGAPGSNGAAVGASPTGSAADDAGVQAALAAIRQIAVADAPVMGQTNSDGAVLYFPHGLYRLSQTLTLDRCITLKGDYQGGYAASAYLQWASSGVHGIVAQTAATGHGKGDNSVVSGLTLVGPSGAPSKSWTAQQLDDAITSPGSSMYGAQPGCAVCVFANRVRVEDCFVTNWDGDAIHIEGVTADKNANDWQVRNVTISNCGRHGLFAAGENSNAGLGQQILGGGDLGGYTIYERSFLGNTYLACHSEGARHSFFVSDSNLQGSTFVGCYQESSDGPASFGFSALILGGTWGNGFNGDAYGGPSSLVNYPGGGIALRGCPISAPLVLPLRTVFAGQVNNVNPASDHTVLVDASGGFTPVVLADPALNPRSVCVLKRIDSSTNVVWVAPANGKLIDGQSVLNPTPGQAFTLQSDGAQWRILAQHG